jgi:hypothetical protein
MYESSVHILFIYPQEVVQFIHSYADRADNSLLSPPLRSRERNCEISKAARQLPARSLMTRDRNPNIAWFPSTFTLNITAWSSPLEAASRSASQGNPSVLCNLKAHFCGKQEPSIGQYNEAFKSNP